MEHVKTEIFRTVNLAVAGMTSDKCSMTVSNALKAIPGVDMVDVSLANNQARVMFTPGKTNLDSLIGAIKTAGYDAKYIDSGSSVN